MKKIHIKRVLHCESTRLEHGSVKTYWTSRYRMVYNKKKSKSNQIKMCFTMGKPLWRYQSGAIIFGKSSLSPQSTVAIEKVGFWSLAFLRKGHFHFKIGQRHIMKWLGMQKREKEFIKRKRELMAPVIRRSIKRRSFHPLLGVLGSRRWSSSSCPLPY